MKRINQIKARIAEIGEQLNSFSASDELTGEQVQAMADLNAEFEALNSELGTLEAAEANMAKAKASQGRKDPAAPAAAATPAATRVGVLANEQYGGFKNSGEYLMAVKDAGCGNVHANFKNSFYEKNGEDGGFIVPQDISNNIIKKLDSNESLYSRTRQFTVAGNSLSLPIDETTPWTGGLQAYWLDEGEAYTETKKKLTRANWRLHKVGALVKLTDEILEDAVAMTSWVNGSVPDAISYVVNQAIVNGDGTSKPTGFLNSAFTVTVPKETGQAADTIVARNIVKMFSRMLPQYRAGAVWLINVMCEPELMTMKDDNGNFIYLAPGSQMNNSPYGLLMGRPVIPMLSSLPQLGDAGDICFVNLDAYFSISKGGVKQQSSIHMHFDRDITAFKFSMRLDGHCPYKSPVNPQNGTYPMSAFVKLADRA